MPCDCDQECEPGTGPEILTRGASKVLGVRVTKGFARELSKACSSAGCTQSDMLRLGLAQLAKASGPDEQLAAVRDALGLEPDAARAAIVAAIDAIFAVVGDPSPEVVDPLAAAPDAPPAKLNRGQLATLARAGLPATPAGWAALTARASSPANPLAALSKTEQAYCAQHKLTAAQFAAKKAGATRSAAPARAAAPTLAATKAATARPAPFTAEQLAYASKHSIPASQLRAHLAARAAQATRRSGQ